MLDVSDRVRARRQLRHQALHDPLTGLANRTLLSDRVEQGLARARRHGEPLGLLMLDVNHFKRINDRLGHQVEEVGQADGVGHGMVGVGCDFLHAARALGGEIVNADSMQVYDRLSILSARPIEAEMGDIAHHLFGVIDPATRCSTGHWARLALGIREEILARGRVAIFVGGTGLYFKALIEGLAPAPDTDFLAREGLGALREEAMRHDPDQAETIEPGDRQRLQRIVELGRAGAPPLSKAHAQTRPLIAPDRWAGIAISPPRAGLYTRIEARFDRMLECGALDEARAIAALELDPSLPVMKAVGLPPLLEHLRGERSLEDAAGIAKRDSRRYAKRQSTWFTHQHPGWARVEALDPAAQREELEAILQTQFSL